MLLLLAARHELKGTKKNLLSNTVESRAWPRRGALFQSRGSKSDEYWPLTINGFQLRGCCTFGIGSFGSTVDKDEGSWRVVPGVEMSEYPSLQILVQLVQANRRWTRRLDLDNKKVSREIFSVNLLCSELESRALEFYQEQRT